MSDVIVVNTLSDEHEEIAQLMLSQRGNLVDVSRKSNYNIMSLRKLVQQNPMIRSRYHELLSCELQDSGIHIIERILKMVELQERAMGGGTETVLGMEGPIEVDIPPDPKLVIELSKEISRLITEGKGQNMSDKSIVVLASKEDAKELLENFFNS